MTVITTSVKLSGQTVSIECLHSNLQYWQLAANVVAKAARDGSPWPWQTCESIESMVYLLLAYNDYRCAVR